MSGFIFGPKLIFSIFKVRNEKDYFIKLLTASIFSSIENEENKDNILKKRRNIYFNFFKENKQINTNSMNTYNFCSNVVYTSKYNVITFLPKVIYLQFSRLANLYTFIIVCLSFLPFSPVGPLSSVIPLLIVLLTTTIKELMEDIKRHKSDKLINNRKTKRFKEITTFYQKNEKTGEFIDTLWKDIKVGDIICIKKDDLLPSVI